MPSSESRDDRLDAEIPALTVAAHELVVALKALDIAKTEHPDDRYLQGQAREYLWQRYWALREAAGDGRAAMNSRLREQRDMALGLVDACATFIGDRGHEDEARRVIERAEGLRADA